MTILFKKQLFSAANLLLLLGLAWYSTPGNAEPIQAPCIYHPTEPKQSEDFTVWPIPANITISGTPAAGTVLYHAESRLNGFPSSRGEEGVEFQCGLELPQVWRLTTNFGPPVSGMPGVYQTNLPGVGIRFTAYYIDIVPGNNRTLTPASPTATLFYYFTVTTASFAYEMDLVATGSPIVSGSTLMLPSPLARTAIDPTSMGARFAWETISAASTTITIGTPPPPTCNVSTPNVSVPMPTMYFPNAATPAGTRLNFTRDFDILLAGCTSSLTGATYRIDPAPGINTAAGLGTGGGDVLLLGPGSTAAGMGIQVFERPTAGPVSPRVTSAIRFGVAYPANNVDNGTQGLSSYTLPFKAEYVRTAGAPAAGHVATQAVFTMTYN